MTKATKEKNTWELRHSALYLMSHEILLQHFLLKRVCQHVALPAVAIGRCYRGRLHPVSRRARLGLISLDCSCRTLLGDSSLQPLLRPLAIYQ